MSRRILILQGHPAAQSLCGALAEAYAQGAREAGHAVTLLALRELAFDPVLHEGYRVVQPLEPDLLEAQRLVREADHLVVVYPTWWGGMPALLKGFFDRMLLPGFGFRYREGSPWWDKYLTGRSGHLITTMDTPPWYYRLVYRDAGVNQLRRTVLEFCGIGPVRVTRIGRVRDTPEAWKQAWLEKVRAMGRRA